MANNAEKELKKEDPVVDQKETQQAANPENMKEQAAELSDEAEEKELEEETLSPEEQLQAELDEANAKYLRLYSDFENFRKRSMKEKSEIILNASKRVVEALLPVLDDFERAMEANKSMEEIEAVKEGFDLIYNKFFGILSAQGLKPMESEGKEFNTDWHTAITKTPAPTEDLKGKIVAVAEKGYTLNDNVLRFAKVVVGE